MASAQSVAYPKLAADYCGRIETALKSYLDELTNGCCERLQEAIFYSLLAPGKRLRPQLVLMAARACGVTDEQIAMPAACAVEMVHTYSLIHDDLPAMDDDDLRRGLPTNHKVYGEALAILAGDALLTLAFELLAREIRPSDTAATCCAALALAAGARGMVGGQVDDLENSRQQPDADELATLESIHRRKTGALFVVSLELGGLTAGADRQQLAMLTSYGNRLGLAFQIVDDLLDIQGREESMGKRVGKDAGHGKLTFPGLLGTEASRDRAAMLVEEACQELKPLGSAADQLEAMAHFVLERTR